MNADLNVYVCMVYMCMHVPLAAPWPCVAVLLFPVRFLSAWLTVFQVPSVVCALDLA